MMVLVLLWSAALPAGFGWVAATTAHSLGLPRTAAYYAVSVFTALLAARTAYELFRRFSKR